VASLESSPETLKTARQTAEPTTAKYVMVCVTASIRDVQLRIVAGGSWKYSVWFSVVFDDPPPHFITAPDMVSDMMSRKKVLESTHYLMRGGVGFGAAE
jgi:hypothetical protein